MYYTITSYFCQSFLIHYLRKPPFFSTAPLPHILVELESHYNDSAIIKINTLIISPCKEPAQSA